MDGLALPASILPKISFFSSLVGGFMRALSIWTSWSMSLLRPVSLSLQWLASASGLPLWLRVVALQLAPA
eukprot:5139862-Lingulodinium_polyedra.AAC.1